MEPHYWSTYNILQLLLILRMIRKNGGWYSPSLQAQGLGLGPLGMSAALILAGLAYNIIERESLRLTNLMHDSHVQSSGKPVQACVRLGSCSARIILCAPYSCFSSPAKAVEVAAPVLTAVLPVAASSPMVVAWQVGLAASSAAVALQVAPAKPDVLTDAMTITNNLRQHKHMSTDGSHADTLKAAAFF